MIDQPVQFSDYFQLKWSHDVHSCSHEIAHQPKFLNKYVCRLLEVRPYNHFACRPVTEEDSLHNRLKLGIVFQIEVPHCDKLEISLTFPREPQLPNSKQQYHMRTKSGEAPLTLHHQIHCLNLCVIDPKPSGCSCI